MRCVVKWQRPRRRTVQIHNVFGLSLCVCVFVATFVDAYVKKRFCLWEMKCLAAASGSKLPMTTKNAKKIETGAKKENTIQEY